MKNKYPNFERRKNKMDFIKKKNAEQLIYSMAQAGIISLEQSLAIQSALTKQFIDEKKKEQELEIEISKEFEKKLASVLDNVIRRYQ